MEQTPAYCSESVSHHAYLVNSPIEIDYNFAGSVIINDLKFADVTCKDHEVHEESEIIASHLMRASRPDHL